MKIITSKDKNKEIRCYFYESKWRAYALAKESQLRKETVRVSEINYDEENDCLLFRDGLEISYRRLSKEFDGYLLLDKRYYPRIDIADYLGSIYFYMNMEGDIISSIYSDVTDSFYEIDQNILFDDEAYAEWKENLISEIIENLKTRSRKRQKQLLKNVKIQNVKGGYDYTPREQRIRNIM